jgi:hypothetical protein
MNLVFRVRRAALDKYAPTHFLPPPPCHSFATPRLWPFRVAGMAFNFSAIEVPTTRKPFLVIKGKRKDDRTSGDLLAIHGALPVY